MTAPLLERVLDGEVPAFALLHRPETAGEDTVDVLAGTVAAPDGLDGIDLPDGPVDGPRHDVLALLPFRQITERGFTCVDDGTPLLALSVTEQDVAAVDDVLRLLPELPITLDGGAFDVDDDAYADSVRRIVDEEIGTGEGANFVVRRTFAADITGYTPRHALTLFRRLLQRESGAYWTFLVQLGDRVLVGATPERHISVHDGTAVMNPISGTYRYPPTGPTLPDVLDFLADRKETDELFMVVDEELKMMARVCDEGGRVVGPYLKEMARLAHTEYFIEGRTTSDPRHVLRETMFAPTVTGSPLESACRVIARHEAGGRGYYSGVVALIGREPGGTRSLDSSIMIRTADIDRGGRVRIGVGATLVRHSDPVAEVAETKAKAAGLLAALGADKPVRFGEHPSVLAALAGRNTALADFWLDGAGPADRTEPDLHGRHVLVVDAEDTFTSMIDHQLRSMGLGVTVLPFDAAVAFADYDLVLMGPGPGDPHDGSDPRIARLRSGIDGLLATRQPFVAVCLSHQTLSRRLGLDVRRRPVPNQGVQREIDLFGERERVGFYNTFAAHSPADELHVPGVGTVEVSRDQETGEVHALRGPHFASMQFHAESVLTRDGVRIVGTRMRELLGRPVSDRVLTGA